MDEILETPLQIDDGGGEEECEEFYENIEAPKFVDFTAPEHYHSPGPEDDRYWFCLRVGCDRKHEEELDPEAIYKNFVLRVMAARSPNVRLRRALNRKALSSNVKKCPLTAPPKSSRTRASRLDVMSSISQKMVDAKVKAKPLTKLNTSTTPNAKANKPGALAKALTTPKNRKRISNPHPFRSVRKPKAMDVVLPKNKVVAKALVFHSPKKAVRIKASLEMDTPMRKLCAGMKKLEITSQKNKPLPSDASRRKLGAREVKSRVFDSLRPQKGKVQEIKSSRCLKGGDFKEKGVKRCDSMPYEDDSSDMEIDTKSRNVSLAVSDNKHEKSLTILKTPEPSSENSAEACSDTFGSGHDETIKSSSEEDKENKSEVMESDDKENASAPDEKSGLEEDKAPEVMNTDDNKENSSASEDKENHCEVIESDDKENVSAPEAINSDDNKENSSASKDKENHSEVMESDDKENASAPNDNNRERHLNQGHSEGKIFGKHKNFKSTQKVTQVLGKTIKDTASATSGGAQVVKYRKPKPTNPKPFRLRTDERRILKEANMEKKLNLPPLKEITTVARFPGGNSRRKHLDAAHEGIEKESDRRRTQNDKKSKDLVKQTRSPLMKQPARPKGFTSSRKEESAPKKPGQLGVISETSQRILKPKKATTKPSENGAISAVKASPPPSTRSLSRGRKRTTIPKEPNFHSIHVPKSCSRKVAEL